MAEIPKGLQHFVARDLNYLIGGGCVVTSFVYSFGKLTSEEWPIALYLLAAGIAYVVGYAVQDIFSVFRVVTTARTPHPRRLTKCLYKRFTGEQWKDLSDIDWNKERNAIKQSIKDENDRAEFERVISLMMICTTMSPCCFVSFAFILCKYWLGCKRSFDLILALVALVLGFVFLILAWIKVAQYTQEAANAIKELNRESQC